VAAADSAHLFPQALLPDACAAAAASDALVLASARVASALRRQLAAHVSTRMHVRGGGVSSGARGVGTRSVQLSAAAGGGAGSGGGLKEEAACAYSHWASIAAADGLLQWLADECSLHHNHHQHNQQHGQQQQQQHQHTHQQHSQQQMHSSGGLGHMSRHHGNIPTHPDAHGHGGAVAAAATTHAASTHSHLPSAHPGTASAAAPGAAGIAPGATAGGLAGGMAGGASGGTLVVAKDKLRSVLGVDGFDFAELAAWRERREADVAAAERAARKSAAAAAATAGGGGKGGDGWGGGGGGGETGGGWGGGGGGQGKVTAGGGAGGGWGEAGGKGRGGRGGTGGGMERVQTEAQLSLGVGGLGSRAVSTPSLIGLIGREKEVEGGGGKWGSAGGSMGDVREQARKAGASEGEQGGRVKGGAGEEPDDNKSGEGGERGEEEEEAGVRWAKTALGEPLEVLKTGGELLEGVCVNALNPRQAVVATNRKGLLFFDIHSASASHSSSGHLSASAASSGYSGYPGASGYGSHAAAAGPGSAVFDSLWASACWPADSYAGRVATPPPAHFALLTHSPSGRMNLPGSAGAAGGGWGGGAGQSGESMGSSGAGSMGGGGGVGRLGGFGSSSFSSASIGNNPANTSSPFSPIGSAVGRGAAARDSSYAGGVGMGIPGYGGIGAWGLGWEDLEDAEEGYVDPPATAESVAGRALAAHPLRPFFLVGSTNTHVYLWQFGAPAATATYGVLPAANTPVPLVIPSVTALSLHRYGERFATAAADGTVSMWQLEVGGRSNVKPTETKHCFGRSASGVAFIGASSSVLAAVGQSPSQDNLVVWDSLAPPNASRVAINCHQGKAPRTCREGIFETSQEYPLYTSSSPATKAWALAWGRAPRRTTWSSLPLSHHHPSTSQHHIPLLTHPTAGGATSIAIVDNTIPAAAATGSTGGAAARGGTGGGNGGGGGGQLSASHSLIVTGGKAGDISVHDFRFIASGKSGRKGGGGGGGGSKDGSRNISNSNNSGGGGGSGSSGGGAGSGAVGSGGGGGYGDRALWHIPRAHSSSVSAILSLPGTPLFLSAGKDGEVKLWDASRCQLLREWPRVHEKRTFLNARGFGAVMQVGVLCGLLGASHAGGCAAGWGSGLVGVMDMIPSTHGLLTCGAFSSCSSRSAMALSWLTLFLIDVLFIVLSPGLLLQIPGDTQPIEFRNWRTSLASVLVHAVVFFILLLLIDEYYFSSAAGGGGGGKHD
ncbi:unnamed protein product, partial [Closterium sp. Naga37s-1]